MGGGVANAELAGAVSASGALGTVGILPPAALKSALERARERAGGAPVAANLLVPFATRAHVDACLEARAAAVALHAGFSRPLTEALAAGTLVLHTVGTPEEAHRALADGAHGLVVQGIEAGGHLVGVEPALQVLGRVLAVAGARPVLLAGGIADAADVRRALDAGAAAAVAGTRFLLTEESGAHEQYKRRVLDATHTLETQLFGLGWPMRHRVVPNAATERWCRRDPLGPRAVRRLQRLSTPLARLPLPLVTAMISTQHPRLPLFGPTPPLVGMPERLADAAPLYAGETALRIESVVPAAEAVRLLTESPTMRSS